MAVGYVFGSSGEEKVMYTREELIRKIAVLLGGRASEEEFLKLRLQEHKMICSALLILHGAWW